jgi:hypothetical protein
MKSKQFSFPVLALLSSASTLVCCVLPALFVALGLGSTVAGFIGAFPQITWLSEHKGIVFALAGALIAFAGFWEWRRRNAPCPLDPDMAKACAKLRRISIGLWFLSVVIYVVSVSFVFIVPKFFG